MPGYAAPLSSPPLLGRLGSTGDGPPLTAATASWGTQTSTMCLPHTAWPALRPSEDLLPQASLAPAGGSRGTPAAQACLIGLLSVCAADQPPFCPPAGTDLFCAGRFRVNRQQWWVVVRSMEAPHRSASWGLLTPPPARASVAENHFGSDRSSVTLQPPSLEVGTAPTQFYL
ncbi:hypothetical protein NDU88_009974 [Pleurodeles waltl]|uniref:Uncharacterized protein n=1 Tax=Pleurodeles waltl TaxID=8319 RepID=A0AAV7RWT2_PLEWA|nr:hypothetical protein NDU88_009974 [Pleurodeles waltl]